MQEEDDMREEYDIEALNPRPNPYAKRLKQQKTIQTMIHISDGNTADKSHKETILIIETPRK